MQDCWAGGGPEDRRSVYKFWWQVTVILYLEPTALFFFRSHELGFPSDDNFARFFYP